MFGGRFLQQTVGIHMGTNCALLLVDLFSCYSYETDFIKGASQEKLKEASQIL
jgi:hypothetical protein